MFFVEIALSIWAWKRGWKALALLPGGLSFLLGFFSESIGIAGDGAFPWIVDLVAIGILIVMVARPRRQSVAGSVAGTPTPVMPAQTITAQAICPNCKSPASPQDTFCRQCGQRIQTTV